MLKDEVNYEEEEKDLFMPPRGKSRVESSASGNQKKVWTSSAQIVEDVDQELDGLKIVYCAHGAAVEVLADRN